MMTGGWLGQSIGAMLLLVPVWLSIGFFGRNFGVRSEVILVWYFLGVVIAPILFGGLSVHDIVPSWKLVGAMLLSGLTLGALANVLLFRAVAGAPNPGIPVAIANASSAAVFLAAIVLFQLAPAYFDPVSANLRQLAGVVLTIIGLALIAIQR